MSKVTIEIAVNDLKDALTIGQTTLSSATDITSHFMFMTEKNKAYVVSTDLPRTFSKIPLTGSKVSYKDEETDSARFTVSGKRILQAASVSQGVITISYDHPNVSFASDKGTLTFASLDPDTFPDWESKLTQATTNVEDPCTVPSDVLAEVLTSLKPYVSEDESKRPELCLVAFIGGVAYACDGYGLGLARHPSFSGLPEGIKIHLKDLGSMAKYLKAHSGNDVKIVAGGGAHFLIMPDTAVYGFTDLPYTYPNVTQKYSDAFDYIPNRAWCFERSNLNTGLAYLNSAAIEGDIRVTFTDDPDQALQAPRIEMQSSTGTDKLGYNLEEMTMSPLEGDSPDLDSIVDLGERMVQAVKIKDAGDEAPVTSFKFNSVMMKRIIDTLSEKVCFGANREAADRGYLIFKSTTGNGVEVASVVGWMR